MTSASPEATDRPPATRRILDAARALVSRGGAAGISMGDVASAAGVSKALVHYHFHDKDSLLQALVDDTGLAVLARARAALTPDPDAHALDTHALDAYWRWLETELRAGDVRILAALAEYDSDRVRDASLRVAIQRREAARDQVATVFDRFGLTPRVSPAILADTVMAFTDGLAALSALDPARDPRPAFDALWLALLTLVE